MNWIQRIETLSPRAQARPGQPNYQQAQASFESTAKTVEAVRDQFVAQDDHLNVDLNPSPGQVQLDKWKKDGSEVYYSGSLEADGDFHFQHYSKHERQHEDGSVSHFRGGIQFGQACRLPNGQMAYLAGGNPYPFESCTSTEAVVKDADGTLSFYDWPSVLDWEPLEKNLTLEERAK